MSSPGWKDQAQAAYQQVQAQIPAAWRLSPELLAPAWVYPEHFTVTDDFLLDVRGVPASCGILSELELKITETDAPALVQRIAAGDWTSLQVTTGSSSPRSDVTLADPPLLQPFASAPPLLNKQPVAAPNYSLTLLSRTLRSWTSTWRRLAKSSVRCTDFLFPSR